jgi:tRNA(Ile)-lysidine synthase
MKYLVAVSGGVDSVVLLDMLADTAHEVVVAHVDHGIRDDSADDARFVQALARHYGVACVVHQANLGPSASEDQARTARYEFLYAEAKKRGAVIVTAHHLDDLVETVALNLERGTGWRGLSVMARAGIWRPLLELPKHVLYDYALRRRLEWVEDSTNRLEVYQRNRLRRRLHASRGASCSERVHTLWIAQLKLRRHIDDEIARLTTSHHSSRYFVTQLDARLATEYLGAIIESAGGMRPTRPQLQRALIAVKTARAGSMYQVGSGVTLQFDTRNYAVKVV